ncbi:VPS10 domain-containing protein [Flavivirga eckloniae]|uniref:Glycosyl hydrolase n=1 Tax=Flavivirga eckloniae TaxID=1803846 RepID=A0A2K9PLI0_9FLAO|nr:glycosyl hydrolase [Flavivirga eckloniae]AUP77437.1 glycosyl hydrolase [Flavivirga eckloniae]
MINLTKIVWTWLCLVCMLSSASAQKKITKDSLLNGLKFRSIGPAFNSGRIADIAIHPENENIWYVGVGSGGVWKTINSGTTWTPIFDEQTSYSIGCITIDPNNSHTIWVGTGENVGGRHVGFGDGIYVSYDDGKTWENKGLKKSEHISKIIIHPEDPNTIWVAAQGPLWKDGGERGVYKSTDGGSSWVKTLGDNQWTGATDLIIDPENANTLYAATWQRHRTVAAYLGGGPGSGIHKSTDGGLTWKKLTTGIPKSNLGKIGLALSPFNSDVVYAAIEMDRRKGGVFMSSNKGESWVKQSDAVSGGTGPHYYQELYASPHQEGKLYLMSNYVQESDDHGKTFKSMNEKKKHVDSHALVFKKSDENYLMFGTDGGLYETFDKTKTWRFINNLPITQYYKLAVDDTAPFYNIYGGTQDNGSHGGPSRTLSSQGITSADWWNTLGADGHQSAIEPGNPNITYGEYQEGWLFRIDQTTGETVFIQPQPKEGEPYERFNWDSPILVSPHKPTRLYFASQRVWKSENRGDEWTPISTDLTRNQNRIELPIMGKQQSWDNAWDVLAMSNYNTITSLAESPKQEGLIYAGTDDGIIQITENGGETWRKLELGSIKGIPSTAFVNDVRADLFDASTVYVALDNHKYGDFKPYLVKSTDKGKTWRSITGDLPGRLVTWRLVQDHVKKELLFVATEFGVYFTSNGGANWVKLSNGIPTISVRDITIQRREDDLVAATFGRGFYILDDISALRSFNTNTKKAEASLFKVKPAYWYIQKQGMYGQGNSHYVADNPPFGAVFTYYLPEKTKTLKAKRKTNEKLKDKENEGIDFPGWEALEKEKQQEKPVILLTVKDSEGNLIKTIKGTNSKGFNRASWDLSYPDRKGEKLKPVKKEHSWGNNKVLVAPGNYTVTLYKRVDGKTDQIGAPQEFKVVQLKEGTLKGASHDKIKAFSEDFQVFQKDLNVTSLVLSKQLLLIGAMKRAADKAINPSNTLVSKINSTRLKLLNLDKQLSGDKTKDEIGEKFNPTPKDGETIGLFVAKTTYGPTATHIAAINRAKSQLKQIKSKLNSIIQDDLSQIEKDLKNAGAPWLEGQGLIND